MTICCTLIISRTNANHLLGGELFYQYLSGPSTAETYKITLVLYGDCGSQANSSSFGLLMSATPVVQVYNGTLNYTTLNLSVDPLNSDIEITPVCPSQVGTTQCTNITNPLPGIKKFTYTATVTLSGTSADWRFDFEGQLSNSLAGRSTILGNIISSGGQIIFLEATLNNTAAPNSSTVYTSVPTPFFCLNQAQGYNLAAVDPNGDSLDFALIPAKLDAFTNVTYIAPYSGTQPVPAVPGTFNFSNTTGQMNFTPNISMNCVVVNQVAEYRNGTKVGSNMREMTFVILPNCTNAAPAPGAISNVQNGTVTGPTTIQVCQGTTGLLQFSFTAADANGDSVTLSYSGLPAGASASITGNGGLNPVFNFSWNVSALALGTYTFYVNFKDNGCPLSSNQTIAYTIQVVPFQGTFSTGGTAGCKGANSGKGWIIPQPPTSGGFSYTWMDASNQVVRNTASSNNGDSLLNFAPGTYTVLVTNNNGCSKTFTVTIPAPVYDASFTVDSVACMNETISFTNTSSANLSGWQWFFGDGGTAGIPNPTHAYGQTGSYTVILVGTTNTGCTDTATAVVQITRVILSLAPNDTACEGEMITLHASGALTYSWTPSHGLSCYNCPSPNAYMDSSLVYTVIGKDAAGCADTASIDIYVVATGLAGAFGDTAICPGDTIQLRADDALSYHWSPPLYISDTSAQNPYVYPPESMTYTFYGTYDLGCTDSSTVKVAVVPKATIYLPDSVTIWPGESYQMDPGTNALYFHWFPPFGLNNTEIMNPVANPGVNTRYFIEASTEWGCSILDSIDVYVRLESVLDIPNAFTPGSAPNQTIKIVRRGDATVKLFSIYNRWGQKVFETSNIDEGWDGTFNGKPQPMGVYVFQVEAFTNTGRRFYKQGNITLLR